MKSVILFASLAFAGATPALSASFTNGDLEAPGGAVRAQIIDGDPAMLTNGDVLSGWSHDGGSFDIYESDDTGDGLGAQSGTHYVSFGHVGTAGGSLSQTFDTVVGGLYSIAYYVAEQQGDDPDQNLQAILTNGAQVVTHDNSGLSSTFTLGAGFSFVALGSSATISFLDATPAGSGGGSNLALDSVSVTGTLPVAGAVPEPASWALMLAGTGLIGGTLRRRRDGAAVIRCGNGLCCGRRLDDVIGFGSPLS